MTVLIINHIHISLCDRYRMYTCTGFIHVQYTKNNIIIILITMVM